MAQELRLIQPAFRTPAERLSREELNKLKSGGLRGSLAAELRQTEKADLGWEAEQLAKSYGLYLEFNRAQSGSEKDWIYMLRVAIPGGRALSREQWLLLDGLAEAHSRPPQGGPTLRLTTRQTVQFHWVRKADVLPLVQGLARGGFYSLNACGDNVRNIMACPLSAGSAHFDAPAMAARAADYFQLPLKPFIEIFALDPAWERGPEEPRFAYGPQLLNRKFKIAFAGVLEREGRLVPDNCVEALTNDLAAVPLLAGSRVAGFQLYAGGGQGQRAGKPSLSTLGQPLAQVDAAGLLRAMDAVVQVHQEWGDRENRHWARLKYLVKVQGIGWLRERAEERLGQRLGDPDPGLDPGPRHLHQDWEPQPDGRWARGVFVENGRLSDESPNGRLRSMVKALLAKFPARLSITPNQDLLFTGLEGASREAFDAELKAHGWGSRQGRAYSALRLRSGSCVGKDTCRLAYTDSEKFEPQLLDELEALGWGHLEESIGVTGCERQCFRPGTKTIGLVGIGQRRYLLKLFGTEDGRHQGEALAGPGFGPGPLAAVPAERVAGLLDALFRFHREQALPGEDLGRFHRRRGAAAILERLRKDPATADLLAGRAPAAKEEQA